MKRALSTLLFPLLLVSCGDTDPMGFSVKDIEGALWQFEVHLGDGRVFYEAKTMREWVDSEHEDSFTDFFSDEAELRAFSFEDSTDEQFLERFDAAFFEKNYLAYWLKIVPDTSYTFYPTNYSFSGNELNLYGVMDRGHGAWFVACNSHLFFPIPKDIVPTGEITIHTSWTYLNASSTHQ